MARVVEGPDVSSIRMLSSTSQAWRGSRVLLPSVTTVTTTTIISSTETPSFHSNTNASDGDHEDEEVGEEEETLSLPSSISRFHASRVQFPPLMPDAVYPLTSTKAFCSPPWPARSGSKGPEGPSSSAAGGDLLDSLDRFSDNTSTQPNVGSSVTSGQASQTVSSSATQSPARRTSRDHRSRSSSAHGDEAQPGRAVPAHRRHARATNAGDGDDEHSDSLTNASDSSEHTRPRAGHRAHLPQPVSPDFPISASELARGRKREKKRPGSDSGPEDEKSEKKHGFFIIPGSGAAKDAGNVHKAANDAGDVAGDVQENGSNDARPGFFVSPSRQPVRHRRQANPRGRVSDGAKQDQGTQDRPPLPPPPVPRNSIDSQRNRPSISADDPRATHGQKKAAQSAEQHPVKLYTCKTPHVPHTEAGPPRSNQQAFQRDLRARTSEANKIPVTGPSRDKAPRSVNELTAPRMSSLSASFPIVHGHQGQGRDTSINLPPRAATLDSSRSSCWSQGRLKRAKSHGHEDYAYINMGGSFSEAQQQAGLKELVYSAVKLGLVRDARQPLPSMSSKPVQNQTTPPIFGQQKSSAMPRQQKTGITLGQHETPSSQADNGRKQQDDVSTAKTDSQILSDILNSFPQTSLTPATTTTTGNADDRDNNNEIKNDLLGSLYPDVTIPTAFADELFGIWSLSPELDEEVVFSNQPRTQLMTPLKVEARRANRKFLWGTSSSQSGSTSTSSFAPGWQLEEGSFSAGGATRRRSAHHRSLAQDDIFGDYVDMSLPTNRDRARDRIRSSPSQMSVSNPTSPDTMPPPSTEAVEVEGDTDTRDTGEYRGVSVPNNLNLSQLYVISGVPDNDDVNNNTATSTAVMNATGNKGGTGGMFPTPRVADNNNVPTLSGSTELVQQNRHSSAPSAFAVVLNQKKFWL